MRKVSIVIPNYNHTRYLGGAIRSALSQTYRSFEIIVIDDGSTDNCREVVAEFGDQVQYIWQENQGLAVARNTGIRAANGEYIGLLDADDQWLPGYLEKMLLLADQHPDAAVYYCSAQGMDENGCELPQVFGRPPRTSETLYHTLLRANFLIPSTILMHRSVVIANGTFDPSLRSCEDWDLWLRLLPEYIFVGTSDRLVRYRIHGHSLSANLAGMQQALQVVVEKYFGPDDREFLSWSKEKRTAYGGVYRYHLLTSVQRENDWQAGVNCLRRALLADPTLAMDLDLFYDLALGGQPSGYRGTPYELALTENAVRISRLLAAVFHASSESGLESLRSHTYGTAFYALGLVAYNTRQLSLSRRFLLSALRFRPDLLGDTLVVGDLIKSLFSRPLLERVKKFGFQTRN